MEVGRRGLPVKPGHGVRGQAKGGSALSPRLGRDRGAAIPVRRAGTRHQPRAVRQDARRRRTPRQSHPRSAGLDRAVLARRSANPHSRPVDLPAVQNMLLAGRALGLGATLTTLYLNFANEAEAALGLPPDWHSYALIPIGYPMGRFGPVRRLPRQGRHSHCAAAELLVLAPTRFRSRENNTDGRRPSARTARRSGDTGMHRLAPRTHHPTMGSEVCSMRHHRHLNW